MSKKTVQQIRDKYKSGGIIPLDHIEDIEIMREMLEDIRFLLSEIEETEKGG